MTYSLCRYLLVFYYRTRCRCCRLGEVKVILTLAAVVMGVYSIILLVFGVLATGSTRKNVYSGARCIQGGRCSALFVSSLLLSNKSNDILTIVSCVRQICLLIRPNTAKPIVADINLIMT